MRSPTPRRERSCMGNLPRPVLIIAPRDVSKLWTISVGACPGVVRRAPVDDNEEMKIATGASLAAILLLAGCSEAPKTETAKAPRKPPEPVTGRQGFQSMFPTARAWALDAQPIQLRSI